MVCDMQGVDYLVIPGEAASKADQEIPLFRPTLSGWLPYNHCIEGQELPSQPSQHVDGSRSTLLAPRLLQAAARHPPP